MLIVDVICVVTAILLLRGSLNEKAKISAWKDANSDHENKIEIIW
jgi:hypothetical protein